MCIEPPAERAMSCCFQQVGRGLRFKDQESKSALRLSWKCAENDCPAMASASGMLLAGLGFWNLQLRDLESIIRNFVAEGPPAAQTGADAAAQQLEGLHLFVCSHGSR